MKNFMTYMPLETRLAHIHVAQGRKIGKTIQNSDMANGTSLLTVSFCCKL